jgi:predicted RNase H-like HicB family nuclease
MMDIPLEVVIHRAEEGGYWAEVPALPGCMTEGETLQELFANVREAVEGWLGASRDRARRAAPADAPAEAGPAKYSATAGSMIGLLKYGSGMPFNRLEGLQGDLRAPLPASTRWDIVKAVAGRCLPRAPSAGCPGATRTR